ncbi:DUF2256 domain-containing protein [Tengunoibacter tsumagoiensis]|uniref:DUF2256 domain-containing protein n=1 Tax=Tengunoibacter tsumagoiensis TaxID=2014871 RepID=UPI000F834C74
MHKKKATSFSKKKGQLPTKICAQCGLPFEWRKRWERNWAEVRYCSDRCRRIHHLTHKR